MENKQKEDIKDVEKPLYARGWFIVILMLVFGVLGFVYSDNLVSIDNKTDVVNNVFDTSVKIPSLDKEIVFPDGFPDSARSTILGNIEKLKVDVKNNPRNISAWLDLAIQYKTIDDLKTAEKIWKYLTKAAPYHEVAFNNLGNIYRLYLKDYKKSEENYKKAIELRPNNPTYYINLHELYKYSYKQNTSLAVDILRDGIEKNPTDINLQNALAGYYKYKGDKKRAIKEYNKTLQMASDLGNKDFAKQIQAEIKALENSLK